MNSNTYYVYLMANHTNRVIYTGVTNNLLRRVFEHKEGLSEGFTQKYKVTKLVYFEQTSDVESAILREKQIKAGSRAKKIALIEAANPTYKDLYQQIL